LEPFYNSVVGLKVIYRPIADFGIPEQLDVNEDIKICPTFMLHFSTPFRRKTSLMSPLSNEGYNPNAGEWKECAGSWRSRKRPCGHGLRSSVGVKNPFQFIRHVKSTYVETKKQEDFVASIPAVIDPKISMNYPELAAIMALGTLQQAQQQYQASRTIVGQSSSHKCAYLPVILHVYVYTCIYK
jgi:hypothetical protein